MAHRNLKAGGGRRSPTRGHYGKVPTPPPGALPSIVTQRPLVYTNAEDDDHEVDKDNTLLRDVAAMKAFFGYMDLDSDQRTRHHLHQSGKNTENTAWSTHNRYMAQLEKRGDAVDDANIYMKTAEEEARLKKNEKVRRKKLKALRKELVGRQAMSTAELIKKLEKIFMSYCLNGSDEIETVQYHRLLRDCRLLDNNFSFREADQLFIEKDKGKDAKTVKGDLKLDFDEFVGLVDKIGQKRFPKLDPENQRRGVLVYYILPFAKVDGWVPMPVDALLTREAMVYLHEYDSVLKQVYAHYSTLDMSFHQDTCWDNVRRKNLTLNVDEFMMCMINFNVVPSLLSKTEVLHVFRMVERENDGDEEVDEMNLPAFIEVLLRLGTLAATKVHDIISNVNTSVTDLAAAKKLLYHADKHVQAQYEKVLHQRGHALKGQLNFKKVHIDYADRMWQQVHQREAAERQKEEDLRSHILTRREELVTKTRLLSGRGRQAPRQGHPGIVHAEGPYPGGGAAAGGGGAVGRLALPPPGDGWTAPARDYASGLEGVELPAISHSARGPGGGVGGAAGAGGGGIGGGGGGGRPPRAGGAVPPLPPARGPGGGGGGGGRRGGVGAGAGRGGAGDHSARRARLSESGPDDVASALDDFESRLPKIKWTAPKEEIDGWGSTIRGAPPTKPERKPRALLESTNHMHSQPAAAAAASNGSPQLEGE